MEQQRQARVSPSSPNPWFAIVILFLSNDAFNGFSTDDTSYEQIEELVGAACRRIDWMRDRKRVRLFERDLDLSKRIRVCFTVSLKLNSLFAMITVMLFDPMIM